MQGEILTSGDPYTIPQKGFNHAWDAHGGGAYLHEHLVDVSTATARLTQTRGSDRPRRLLPTGLRELLAARPAQRPDRRERLRHRHLAMVQLLPVGEDVLCCCCPKHLADTAHAGRREGAFWSVSQAPHMDGIYCKSLLTVCVLFFCVQC